MSREEIVRKIVRYARNVDRVCLCAHDYRCSPCDAIVEIRRLLRELDKIPVRP